MILKMLSCVFFLFLSTHLLSQNRVFEDLDGNRISKEDFFNIIHNSGNLYAYKALHDTVITFLYAGSRDFEGKLLEGDFQALKKLYHSNEKGFPIIIQYFPGVDDCSQHFISRRQEMIRFLKDKDRKIAKGKKNLFSVYKSNKGIEKLSEQLKWRPDKSNLIEHLFFPYHFPCGSYVVVNEKGSYRGYFGEYGANQILEDYKILKLD